MTDIQGTLTKVQRFCIHDGPGIRTTAFLKGCSLRCFWCHNPETWRRQPDLQYFPGRCIACGECVSVCPNHAHQLLDGKHRFDRTLCENCGKCAEVCMTEALVMTGETYSVDSLVSVLERDRVFYDQSGGGITLSGGEPLIQPVFSTAVLQACQEKGLNTAIETCLMGKWEDLEAMLPFLDMVIMDIKVMDSDKHQAAIGASNERILANAKRLMTVNIPVLVRTPVIPNVNDNVESIRAIAAFIQGFPNLTAYELMPFHRLGEEKFKSLGIPYQAQELESPSVDQMNGLADAASEAGVRTVLVA